MRNYVTLETIESLAKKIDLIPHDYDLIKSISCKKQRLINELKNIENNFELSSVNLNGDEPIFSLRNKITKEHIDFITTDEIRLMSQSIKIKCAVLCKMLHTDTSKTRGLSYSTFLENGFGFKPILYNIFPTLQKEDIVDYVTYDEQFITLKDLRDEDIIIEAMDKDYVPIDIKDLRENSTVIKGKDGEESLMYTRSSDQKKLYFKLYGKDKKIYVDGVRYKKRTLVKSFYSILISGNGDSSSGKFIIEHTQDIKDYLAKEDSLL